MRQGMQAIADAVGPHGLPLRWEARFDRAAGRVRTHLISPHALIVQRVRLRQAVVVDHETQTATFADQLTPASRHEIKAFGADAAVSWSAKSPRAAAGVTVVRRQGTPPPAARRIPWMRIALRAPHRTGA